MLNIISGDLYRLRKSKSLIISLAVMVVVTLFSYFIMDWAEKVANGEASENAGAVHVTVDDAVLTLTDADIIDSVVSSKYFTVIFAIFVCVWITSEFASGAIKNTVGKGCPRVKVFLAKYITAVGIVLAMSVISYIVAVFAGVLLVGTEGVNAAFCVEVLKYVGVQLIHFMAYAGIIVAVSELTRSMVAGIVVSVIIEFFSMKLFGIIDLILSFVGVDLKLSEFWIIENIYECFVGDISASLAGRAAVVSVFWILVSLGIGMWHFKRTDVK